MKDQKQSTDISLSREQGGVIHVENKVFFQIIGHTSPTTRMWFIKEG